MRLSNFLTFCTLLIIAVPCSSAWGQPSAGFDPQHQRPISAQDKDDRAQLVLDRHQIVIFNKQRQVAAFPLPSELVQVDEIFFANKNTLVVFGRLTWAVSGVLLYDLLAEKIRDYLWCYKPSLSPDRRFLAYQKFFPQHFTGAVSAEYLIYDLQKTPEQNRSREVQSADKVNAGLAIYPPGLKNRPADNLGVPASEVHWMSSDGFYWSEDSARIAFADLYDSVNTVIVAEILKLAPKVSIKRLPVAQIVNPKGLTGICEGEHPERWFRVAKIDFDKADPARLRVRFSAPSPVCLSMKEMDLSAKAQ